MLLVTTQNQKEQYLIEYFHLNLLENKTFEMVGLARLNLTETKLVHLGYYKFYRQAIDVFAQMDYKDNDLMYFKEQKKIFVMPENILDPQVCIAVYGGLY